MLLMVTIIFILSNTVDGPRGRVCGDPAAKSQRKPVIPRVPADAEAGGSDGPYRAPSAKRFVSFSIMSLVIEARS